MVLTRRASSARGLVPRACIAVDWCGALADVRKRLWLAEARDGRITRLEHGRDRRETVDHLVDCARREPRLVVGLDFAFSFPAWFLAARGIENARAGWELAARDGETWLAHCPRPFWGKPGVRRPAAARGRSEWRATEGEAVRVRGVGPKSVFQVGGAGSVGTGSLRGMPHLLTLQAAGFSIWPFDAPRLPMVVEIYPRYLTGPVNKSSGVARALYLQAHHRRETRSILDAAGGSEDAFDAAVSAVTMLRGRAQFARLAERDREDEREQLEGRIWMPLRDPMFACWQDEVRRDRRSRRGA